MAYFHSPKPLAVILNLNRVTKNENKHLKTSGILHHTYRHIYIHCELPATRSKPRSQWAENIFGQKQPKELMLSDSSGKALELTLGRFLRNLCVFLNV